MGRDGILSVAHCVSKCVLAWGATVLHECSIGVMFVPKSRSANWCVLYSFFFDFICLAMVE